MTTYGQRIPHGSVRLVGRDPVDYAQELQDYLGEMSSLASVVNTVISVLPQPFPEATLPDEALDTSGILAGQIFGR